jgi:hypothetical protein
MKALECIRTAKFQVKKDIDISKQKVDISITYPLCMNKNALEKRFQMSR